MKLLITLCMIITCTYACFAEDRLIVQRDLPAPPTLRKSGQTEIYSPRLKKHIDSGDLVSFYKEAALIFKTLPSVEVENYTDEILLDQLWVHYYVANAPLFKKDFDVTTNSAFRDDDDISTKTSVILNIERMGRDDIMNVVSLDKKKIRELMVLYSARIFKDLRAAYDPNVKETVERIDNLPIKTLLQAKFRHNKAADYERRNTKIASSIEWLEEELVGPIVRYNHGKANEVRRLIRLAGYTDEEGADLIDRTVGRHKHTEFLYQGKYGRRHDKKVEQGRKKGAQAVTGR